MYEKTKGIVLRVNKLDDERKILEVYTKERGCLSFVVNSNVSKNSKLKNVYFFPLTVLTLEYDYRQRYSMQTISGLVLNTSIQSGGFNPYKSAISLFLAEFLSFVLKHEPHNEPLFDFIENSLKWLQESYNGFNNFHLLFMAHISKFLGIPPSMETYRAGMYFDMMDSVFVTEQPTHPFFLVPEAADLFSILFRTTYDTMSMIVLSRQNKQDLMTILTRYYQLHYPGIPDLKSQSVLTDVFG